MKPLICNLGNESVYYREPRQFSSVKSLQEITPYPVVSVKCNCTCTHLSVVTATDNGPSLHIVEMEGNQKISYSMSAGLESCCTIGELPESVRVGV